MAFPVSIVENGFPVTVNGVTENNLVPELKDNVDNIVYESYTTIPNLYSANGATVNSNNLIIPIAQTGDASFFGFQMQSVSNNTNLKKIVVKLKIEITNYLLITQPIVTSPIVQQYQNGSYLGNVTDYTFTFLDSIINEKLVREFEFNFPYTKEDVDNNFYYRFFCNIRNSILVSNSVTVNVTGEMIYHIDTTKFTKLFIKDTSLLGAAGGATQISPVITIPTGQTGHGTFFGVTMPDAIGLYLGQVIEAEIKVVITNYTALVQPVTLTPRAQRYKAGVFQLNTTPSDVTFTESIVGTTLTRTYKIKQIITQNDLTESFYYYYILQLTNLVAVSSNVTFTINSSLNYRVDYLLASGGSGSAGISNSTLERTIKNTIGQYSGFITRSVKKDGTGDFLTIQAAIDSITDASLTNQYEVLVYDDFFYTSRSNLNGGTDNSTAQSYVFITKDYVHVRGVGSMKKISVLLPNNSSANNLIYTQTAWHSGFSKLENLEFIIKNGRYAIHTEGAGTLDADDWQMLVNCKLNHLGNQDAVNFASWKSDIAWGFGNSSGQKVYAKNCQFIARKQSITYHTNVSYSNPTLLKLENCSLMEREPTTIGSGTIDSTLSMNASELGSNQKNTLELIGCTINNHIVVNGDWYLNVSKRDDVFTHFWNITGYGNSPISFKLSGLNVLKFDTVVAGQEIEVTGGTAKALIFGEAYLSKKGVVDAKGFTVGSISIARSTNGFVTNYMNTLGHRLGNCTTVNKTLILKVNNIDYTVTFDKNYSGGSDVTIAPAFTYTQILNEINTALSGVAVATDFYVEFYPEITDMYLTVKNSSSTESILSGMGVVYDYTRGKGYVRKAVSGETIDGIALSNIMPYFNGISDDTGKMMIKGKGLIDRWQFFAPYGYNPGFGASDTIEGKMLKIGSTAGSFIETAVLNEAVLIAIDRETWKFK